MESWFELGYYGLFLAAFLAATVLPFSSEGILVAMFLGGYDPILTVAIATIGNWAGGMTSYFLGYAGKWQWLEKYFKVKKKNSDKWKIRADKYGAWLALLCWAPIIGDVIAIALGVFRVNAFRVAVLMGAGKLARYIVLAWITFYAAT